MKPRFIIAILALSLGLGTAMASSPVEERIDSLKKSHHVISFGKGEEPSSDSIQKIITEFYYDQFRHYEDPSSPYFMFLSKDNKLAMGIGGCIRFRGWYDWGGYVPTAGFIPAMIPMHPDPANRRALDANPSGTGLFFKVLGRNKYLGLFQLYIEAQFSGYGMRDFKLKKSYGVIGDWTIGYAPSTFSDPAARPFTIDSQGPNSEITTTNVLLRWMHTMRKHHVIAASVEMPNENITPADSLNQACKGYAPNIAAFYQYQWGNGQHVRLMGVMRFLPYRDLISRQNKTVVGWGLKLSSIFRPWNGPVTVYLDANYGHGDASLTQDLSVYKLDLISNPDRPGGMYAPAVFGYYGAVQYNFSPKLFSTAVFSEVRYLPSHKVAPDTYRYGLYGAVNLMWYMSPRILVGVEFDVGKLKEFSGDSRWARRIGAVAQLSS